MLHKCDQKLSHVLFDGGVLQWLLLFVVVLEVEEEVAVFIGIDGAVGGALEYGHVFGEGKGLMEPGIFQFGGGKKGCGVGGHECVLVQRSIVRMDRGFHKYVAAVGAAYVAAVDAEQGGLAYGPVFTQVGQYGAAGHIFWFWQSKVIQYCSGKIYGLDEGVGGSIALFAHRVPDKQGQVDKLLIKGHVVFGPEIMFAEHVAVVGINDEQGVLPEVIFIKFVQDTAKAPVAHG